MGGAERRATGGIGNDSLTGGRVHGGPDYDRIDGCFPPSKIFWLLCAAGAVTTSSQPGQPRALFDGGPGTGSAF